MYWELISWEDTFDITATRLTPEILSLAGPDLTQVEI